jgi:hypothetical protein
MNLSRFEQDFSWLKTYAHEAKEIAEVLVNENDFFKQQILQALEKHSLPEARLVVEALHKTVQGLNAKVLDVERAYASISEALEV